MRICQTRVSPRQSPQAEHLHICKYTLERMDIFLINTSIPWKSCLIFIQKYTQQMPPKVTSQMLFGAFYLDFMLIYVDLGLLLGGRFGLKTELVFDKLSSQVLMLIYVDFRRIWELKWQIFRDKLANIFTNVRFSIFVIPLLHRIHGFMGSKT